MLCQKLQDFSFRCDKMFTSKNVLLFFSFGLLDFMLQVEAFYVLCVKNIICMFSFCIIRMFMQLLGVCACVRVLSVSAFL